jgi:isopentenyl-diphosphate Delta-isomerase
MEPYVDTVDDFNRPTGRARKSEVYLKRANFRAVHVLIFNSRGQVYVPRIASGNRDAGKFGSSSAGFVLSGESYEAAAKRKITSELGFTPPILRNIGVTQMVDQGCRKFISVYTCEWDGQVRPNPQEVEGGDFRDLRWVQDMIDRNPSLFSETFKWIFTYYMQYR